MEYIMRNKKRHYVDVGGKWAPVGRGFALFEEKKKPERVTRQYFHESGSRTRIVGYTPEIKYELDAIARDEASLAIRGITDRELSGDAAIVQVLSVDMTAESVGGAYPAICRSYCVVADGCGGDDVLSYKGTLVCASPAVRGVFVVQSGVFVREVD